MYTIITAAIQIQWLAFAPIARDAWRFFDATALQVDFFAVVFMVVFLAVASLGLCTRLTDPEMLQTR